MIECALGACIWLQVLLLRACNIAPTQWQWWCATVLTTGITATQPSHSTPQSDENANI